MTRSRWWNLLERLRIVEDPRRRPVGSRAWWRRLALALCLGLVMSLVMAYVIG